MSAPGPQPPPSEITAEWTVHAQLTLSSVPSASSASTTSNNNSSSRPSDVVPPPSEGCTEGEPGSVPGRNPGGDGADSNLPTPPPPPAAASATSSSNSGAVGNPVKVVYKFSTADHPLQQKPSSTVLSTGPLPGGGAGGGSKSNVIFNTDPSSPSSPSVTLAQVIFAFEILSSTRRVCGTFCRPHQRVGRCRCYSGHFGCKTAHANTHPLTCLFFLNLPIGVFWCILLCVPE